MPLDVGKLRALLELDTGQYKTDLRQARSDFEDLGRTVEQVSRTTETATDGTARGVRQLGDAARQASGDVDQATRDMTDAFNRAQDEARRAGQGIQDSIGDSAAGAGNRIRDELGGALGEAGEQGEPAGDDMGGGLIAGFASKLGGKGGPIVMAITAAVAGAAAIGMKAGETLYDNMMQGMEIKGQRGLSQAQFGFSEEQMARVGQAAGGAWANAWGESVNDNIRAAGIAMQSGLLDGDATAAQIQPVIEQLHIVSRVMDEDISEVARGAGQMIKTGLVDNTTQAFDLMVRAQQKGLNLNEDLIDTLNEYGTQWRKLGIDGTTAMGTISQMMRGGARDADIAADALKEFSIRVVDGSDLTKGAFTDLGLNAEATAEQFGKGGEAAKTMADTVIDRLAAIEDPIKRNEIGVALFGTQWEDLGAAINQMDLGTAAREMGQVADATKNAGNQMSTGADTIQGLRNRLTMLTDDMKVKLADALGPAVSDIANAVLEHQDDIVGFFKALSTGALTLGVVMGNTAAGILHVWGWLTKGLSFVVSPLLKALGVFGEAVGGLVSLIPGMDSVGNAIQKQGEITKAAGEGFASMGDKAHGLANFIADSLVPGMAKARDAINAIPNDKTIQITDQGGEQVMGLLKELGVQATINNDKEIEVSAPLAPSVIQQLQQIGIEVQQRGEKQVLVKMDRTAYDNFKQDVSLGGTFKVLTQMMTGQQPTTPQDNRPKPPDMMGQMGGHWAGGWTGPGSKYQPAGIVHADEFVIRKEARQQLERQYPGMLDSMNQTGRLPQGHADGGYVREPYGLPAGTDTGGYGSSGAVFSQWVHALESAFGVKASTYAGHQEKDGYNKGIDWSGSVDAMQRLAEYFASIKEQLEQVIWDNPQTGQKIGVADGRFVGPGTDQPGYYAADWADHQNHVHSRQSWSIPAPGQILMPQGQQQQIPEITLTATSSKDDVARKIIAEGRKRGYTDAEIQAILSTGLQESGLSPGAVGGGGAWKSIFQQDSGYPGRDDPNTNITGFYDRLDAKRKSPGASDDIWENIFWLQQRPGEQSAKAAVANGRQAYLSEIQSQSDVANEMLGRLGPSIGTLNQQNYYGQYPNGQYPGTDDTGQKGEPPEDPSVVTLEFDNPLQPFWWKGEREYRQRIIDDYERQQKWNEYHNGKPGDNDPKKGMKKVTVKSIDEATRDLEDAKSDRDIVLQRQREMKPDAELSSKMSMQKQVNDAQQKVRDAEAALADAKANPNGYKYVPDPEKQQQLQQQGQGQQPVYRADGGPVYGRGFRRDDMVPAMLSHREFVHQTDAVDYYGLDTMHALNRREIPRGLLRLAEGGFAGYSDDTSDTMAPNNWYDLAAMGVGAGFAAYNMIEPYAQMAITGNVNLGNITPSLNTGTTSTGMLSEVLSNVSGQISKQLTDILWAIKEGKDIHVKIDGARPPSYTNQPRQAALAARV